MKIETQIPISPRIPATPLNKAADAWQRQDYQRTIEILKCALQQQPTNCKLLLNLAEAYGRRFDYAEAEHWLEQAVKVASRKTEILAESGRRCQRFNQPVMGNRYFKRAAEHADVSAWVLVAMAEFEASHSRVESALTFLEKALELEPKDPDAQLVRARLHRVSEELDEGEKLLRALLPRAMGDTVVKAWYELGTNLDRQGRYDEAMMAFLKAKALVYPASVGFVGKLKKVQSDVLKMEEKMSASLFERWLAAGPELQPAKRLALLCGHPRSGTTLLEHVLEAHPGIVATDETPILLGEAYQTLSRTSPENASMLEVLESASLGNVQKARADYFRFMESVLGEPIGNRLLVDKNPALDVHIPTFVRIFPEARFVVAIRDPRDVCLSCFMLPLPPGQLSALYLDFEQTASQYAFIMGVSRAIRSRAQSPQMEVRYEDVVTDLEGNSRRVLRFLGLDWDQSVLRFNDHSRAKGLRCAIDDSVAKPIFTRSVGRWRHYQKYLEPGLEQLKPFIKALGYE